MDAERSREILAKLVSFPLRAFPAAPLALHALDIAVNAGCTAYDSLYVALAAREDAPLVTADEKLFNALPPGPLGANVLWVGDV